MARRELNLDLKTILKFESGFEALKWLLKSIWKCKVPNPKYGILNGGGERMSEIFLGGF